MALSQKVFINGTEIVGASALIPEWLFEKQTSVVKNRTRLVSGDMSNGATLPIMRHISDDPLFVNLQKGRQASNQVIVQVFANKKLIREFTFVEAIVTGYCGLGHDECESLTFETLANPDVTIPEVDLDAIVAG